MIFGRHDLLSDAPISRVDLLLCRNTLMYFHREAQNKIVERFHYALRDGAFLVLGRAEMLVDFADMFAPLDPEAACVREAARPDGSGADDGRLWAPRRSDPARNGTLDAPAGSVVRPGPDGAVRGRCKGHLLMINARARDLFGITPRDIGRPLQDLEVSYRPADLRSCIDEAHTHHHVVMLREVTWPTPAGDARYFNVQVTPILDAADSSLGSKIIFIDVTRQRELQDALHHSQHELEAAYEELQSTNEELETTNEELQSTVEELETTNEELQSTNEELETMNEELQSTNEEFEKVNNELKQREIDLSRTNVFLTGILRSVPLAVIVLDDQLHVELWNDVAADLWGLRAEEVYRRHFFGLDIGLPVEQLKQPLAGLLRQGDQRFEVQVNAINRRGRQIQLRVQAVGTGSGDHGKGIIILMQETLRSEAVLH